MNGYATWVRRQPLLARAGTPIWTTVQTQVNEALRQQIIALEPGAAPPLCVSSDQIRLLAYVAVASGSRGLVFLSDSPLDSADAETQQRAMTLELLNLELELMEPWAAAGTVDGTAESHVQEPPRVQESPQVQEPPRLPGMSRPQGPSSHAKAQPRARAHPRPQEESRTLEQEVVGTLLRTEHARLLLPIWLAPRAQYVLPQSAANSVTLVVPGVPEANNAYELTPSGVQSLRHLRVAGGMSVTLDEFGLTTQVLLAHDPFDSLIIEEVKRRAAELGPRAGQLQRHLAVYEWNKAQTLAGQLATRIAVPEAAAWLEKTRDFLQTCDTQLRSGDTLAASQNAQRAMRSLRLVERAYWDVAVKGLASPVTSPGAVSFDTLPYHWRLVDRLKLCRFGPNRIAGGDFEDLDTMMRAGWRYIQHGYVESCQATVDLAPDAAHTGRLGLRLAAVAVDPKMPPAVVETPPVLFTSPPVQVRGRTDRMRIMVGCGCPLPSPAAPTVC